MSKDIQPSAPPQAFHIPIDVRFRDLDGLGHINNAVYHSYIEQARTVWLNESPLMTSAGKRTPRIPVILARTEMDFLQQGSFSDKITVSAWISRVGGKSFDSDYEVMAEGKGVITRARAVLVWFDYEKNVSIPIPSQERAWLQAQLA